MFFNFINESNQAGQEGFPRSCRLFILRDIQNLTGHESEQDDLTLLWEGSLDKAVIRGAF